MNNERHLQEELQKKKETRLVMSSSSGRRFVYRLLESCGVHHLSFDRDPLQMAFNEGRRNIGLMVEHWLLEACSDEYRAMMDEQDERSTRND